jgi:hypothetical protein
MPGDWWLGRYDRVASFLFDLRFKIRGGASHPRICPYQAAGVLPATGFAILSIRHAFPTLDP